MTPEEIAKILSEDEEILSNGSNQFLWVTASGNWIVKAESYENAYDKVVKNIMLSGQSKEEAKRLFEKDDKLFPIDGEL